MIKVKTQLKRTLNKLSLDNLFTILERIWISFLHHTPKEISYELNVFLEKIQVDILRNSRARKTFLHIFWKTENWKIEQEAWKLILQSWGGLSDKDIALRTARGAARWWRSRTYQGSWRGLSLHQEGLKNSTPQLRGEKASA